VEFDKPADEGVCDACGGSLFRRDDDAPDTVRHRLEVYGEQTGPLVAHYRESGLLRRIDAAGSVEAVTERAITTLESACD
jgi:adenylate kinase